MAEYISTPQTRLGNSSSKNCLKYNRITNCITEIPQDIKIKSIGDSVTFSAGTKLYVPNGFESDGVTKKFDTVILDKDYVARLTDSAITHTIKLNWIVVYFTDNLTIRNTNASYIYSGDTKPTTTNRYSLWYDTANNKILVSEDTGATYIDRKISLPLFTYERIGGKFHGLTQVFNGLGYIGKINYILPQVKMLVSSGYNKDGTYKNKEYVIEQVLTSANDLGPNSIMFFRNKSYYQIYNIHHRYFLGELSYTPNVGSTFEYYYNVTDRLWYMHEQGDTAWRQVDYCIVGYSTSIKTNFKECFQSLDSNDTAYIAHQSFPSDKAINLTLGASGTTYVAPADGYFDLRKMAETGGQYIKITGNIESCIQSSVTEVLAAFCLAKKGDVVKISYTASGTTYTFRFVLAQGTA